MDINKEREAFEKLWTGGNGHLRFFKFDHDACKYLLNGVTDNLPKGDLLSASITLNTAWLFWLGAKQQATPEGFVLVPRECPDPIFADKLFADLKTRSFICDGEEFINLCDIDPIVVWKMVIEAQEQSHD